MHYWVNGNPGNFFSFAWDLYWNKPPLAVNHLWFVISLFAYSLILGGIVKSIPLPENRTYKLRWYYPLIVITLGIMLNLLMRQIFPIDRWVTWLIPLEPAHLPNYVLAFVAGYVMCRYNMLEQLSWRMALSYFGLYILVLFLRVEYTTEETNYYFRIVYENTLCVGVSFFLMKLFQLIPKNDSKLAKILSENTYGCYLVHLWIVLGYQYVFLSIEASGWTKFLVVFVLSCITSMLVSYWVRKIPGVSKII